MKKIDMKRNTSIEFYRVVLMFGIVLLHCVSQGPIKIVPLYHLLMPCVTGFVFISGWFGIRFSWKKCLSLFATGFICRGLSCLLLKTVDSGPADIVEFWHGFVGAYWFLWAYLVLMLLSPMIEMALSNVKKCFSSVKWSLPLFVLVFVWNSMTSMPGGRTFAPAPTGFGTHTFLMMVGVYVAARLCRIFDFEKALGGWRLYAVLGFSGILCLLGLSHYDSVISFVFVAACFYLSKRHVHLHPLIGRGVLLIAPSMLSVYCIHWSPFGWWMLKQLEANHENVFVAFGTAVVLFVMSLLLDLPRRYVFSLLEI